MSTVTYDYVTYFPIIPISIKLVFFLLCSLHFFHHGTCGCWGTNGFGLAVSSKIIFLSFFIKHKDISINYCLILTTFFLFFNGIWPLQGQWTTFNDLYMKQSTEQWAWKIVILTFIIRPVSASINWCLTIYQSAPSDVRSSSSGSAIAQFNFCLLSVNGPAIYCCAPVKCVMVVCRPVSMLELFFFSFDWEAYLEGCRCWQLSTWYWAH